MNKAPCPLSRALVQDIRLVALVLGQLLLDAEGVEGYEHAEGGKDDEGDCRCVHAHALLCPYPHFPHEMLQEAFGHDDI